MKEIIQILNLLGISEYEDINHRNADSDSGETHRTYKLKNKERTRRCRKRK